MAYGLTKSAQLTKASAEYFSRADTASLSGTGSHTWELWVKFDTVPSATYVAYIANKFDVGGDRSWSIWFNKPSGTTQCVVYTTADGSTLLEYIITFLAEPSTGVWYHYRITYNTTGPAIKFYVDGVDQGTGSGSIAASIKDSASTVYIGTNYSGPGDANQQLDGNISLVRFWDEVHTASDSCTFYGTATTNMAAEWSLDDVIGDGVQDTSGNSNTLTAVNTPTYEADVPAICQVTAVAPLPTGLLLMGTGV